MDHFEGLVTTLLEADDQWVRRSFKVNVTKEEKRLIGKHSIPRPEIDLLALDFSANEVLALEVKSYLDSSGVRLSDLREEYDVPTGRYKLFTCERYRSVVLSRLHTDLIKRRMASADTRIRLGLAAGNVHRSQSDEIRELFDSRGWTFWSPEDVKERVIRLAERDYENDPAIMTAKILLR